MQPLNRFKLGGKLLAAGAGLALLVKTYWLFTESPFSMGYRVVSSVFGSWFAMLVMRPSIDGTTLPFGWTHLLFVPWAAVFIGLLLWVAVKVTSGQFKSDRVPLPVLGVLGSWFLVGQLYEWVSNGLYFFGLGLGILLPSLLADLATIAMIVGLGLILLSHREAMTMDVVEASPWRGDMTLSRLLFSFEGRINRAKYVWTVLVISVVLNVTSFAVGFAIGSSGGDPVAGAAAGMILGLGATVLIAFLAVKRLHDLDRPGTHYWLLLVPFYNLYLGCLLVFKKGTGENQYGPDPLAGRIEPAR